MPTQAGVIPSNHFLPQYPILEFPEITIQFPIFASSGISIRLDNMVFAA